MDLPQPLDGDAINAVVYVRPHQMEISLLPDGTNQLRARIMHINAAGPLTKLELLTRRGESIRVEMLHERMHQMALRRGLDVYVSAREARIYTDSGIELKPRTAAQASNLRAWAAGFRRRD
jgi:sulfate transport system ATP-binding protein